MTREQWQLEPHPVEFFDLDDPKTVMWINKGLRHVDEPNTRVQRVGYYGGALYEDQRSRR
jgi:hypothetical protein